MGSIFLHQREKGETHTLSDRQQGSLVLPFCLIRLNKKIWHYLLNHNIAITAEYLPSVLNTVADRESRKKPDPSEWLLHPKVFQAVSRLLGSPTIDLFAFCLCHQLPQYIAWHPDPFSQGTDAMIQNCNIGLLYAFPPFSMISKVLLKIKQECDPLLILIAPVWSTQPWYPELLNLCQGTSAAAPGTRNSDTPKKYCPSIDGGELIDTSDLVGFRKTLLCEGISENASQIITNSRRKGRLSNYESA